MGGAGGESGMLPPISGNVIIAQYNVSGSSSRLFSQYYQYTNKIDEVRVNGEIIQNIQDYIFPSKDVYSVEIKVNDDATSLRQMFRGTDVITLSFGEFNFAKITEIASMCLSSKLTRIDMSKIKNTRSYDLAYFLQSTPVNYIDISPLAMSESYFRDTTFAYCKEIVDFVCNGWRYSNIVLVQSSKIIPKTIHDLIDHSMNLADGAKARTLTLNATTKANWEASEYYQTDLELLVTKGITIA
jgi:hypothetical protein